MVKDTNEERGPWTIEDSERVYAVKSWSDGYFDINDKGHLVVTPDKVQNKNTVDIYEVIEEMKDQNIGFPAVIRFHDVLRSQVKSINRTFRQVIEEANYEGRYMGVYPVKVNQMREVVEEIVDAGSGYDYGLEAGSKPELLSVLALNSNEHSLTILNGYKDSEYMRLALLGNKIGRKMVVVIEKFSELEKLVKMAKEMDIKPMIGLRAKMSIKGRGKWAESSGEKAKFGLVIAELLNAVEYLKQEGYLSCIKLFHFHIGSQITDIRTVKEAIDEGGRIYSKLVKMGVPMEYFDVGGGLGVDYDGSQSTNESSKNYNVHEYAADIVFGLKQICDLEGVAHPNIVTESGRFITAHHSCVITNVIGKVDSAFSDYNTKKVTGEHHFVTNIRELSETITANNIQEIYNEASAIKEDGINAFKLGVINLEERAKIETLYWKIVKDIYVLAKTKDFLPEEMWGIEDRIAPQYLCNFSVFQSTADSWAIDQLLPVVPITRLNEEPLHHASLVDITCDSDGKIDKFIDREEGNKKTVPLHEFNAGDEYYVGIFLTGAYQDVMGDTHNLFGRLNEVHVFSDSEDPYNFYIEETIKGHSSADVLSTMQYNPDYMALQVKKSIDKKVSQGKIQAREGVKLVDFYESCLKGYTYLKPQ